MKRLLIILLILLIVCPLFSATWYVRPAGGAYGAEDGTTYADAWDGLENVVWGIGGVDEADTLYICGLHLSSKPPLANSYKFTPPSGTNDSTRTIIRGDYPADAGIVWSSFILDHEAWVDELDGSWSITLPFGAFGDWFFEDITALTWVVLDKVANQGACAATPGTHYSATYGAATTLYVHCSDSNDPTGRVTSNRYGYAFHIEDNAYITFLNLEFYNMRPPVWDGDVPHHITYDTCTVSYCESYAFSIYDGVHNFDVIDCDISWAGNGIYNISDTNNAPHTYTYSGNTIYHIGVRALNQNGDAHAVGIQGGHDGIIEDNYCWDCGSTIVLYAFTDQTFTDTIVRRNFVIDSHSDKVAPGYGIECACDNDSLSDKSGNEIYLNIVSNCVVGLRNQWEDEVKIYNNVSHNCTYGFYSSRNFNNQGSNTLLKNNIFLDNTDHIGWVTGAANYTIVSDYNLFFPDDGTRFKFGAADQNFATWQGNAHAGCTFDPNSSVADPAFVNAGGSFDLDTDFMIPTGSPAKDAGTNMGLGTCYFGVTIPSGAAPDIGSHEFDQGDAGNEGIMKPGSKFIILPGGKVIIKEPKIRRHLWN